MSGIDWQGIATVIGALAALFTAIAAIMARKPVLDTHAAVTATNGDTRPLGEIAASAAKTAEEIKTIVTPGTADTPPPTP